MTNRCRLEIIRDFLVVALLGAALITPAAGADQSLGTFASWSSMRFSEGGTPVCMMWSQPEKSEGDYTRRGDVFVFITHRPGDDEMNKVSFETGYTFEESSDVDVDIDGTKFTLYTDKSTAWTLDPGDDTRMVNAMRAGSKMVVKGTSSRGTLTTDTYSLRGFTAAHNAINKACTK
ncbi:MAG: invasion associated locus B family protein [Gammaproteobacteria bacterium]|nr:invasion associated locus B family protein [Gammaproteobacteria bacterium]